MWPLQAWAFPFAISFLFAMGLTAVLVRVAPKKGWVSLPSKDRWNVRVVAQYGGIPIFLAFSVAVFSFFLSRRVLELWLLTLGMAMIGMTDDILKLPPKPKLLGQAVIAALAVHAGIVFSLTSYSWINAAVTMFWIVGITNALNLLDNMDGVAVGIAIVAAASLVLIAGPADFVRGPALCLLGAMAGFLIFNVNPAKVFMGDVGALPIGFFLACACIGAVTPHSVPSGSLLLSCLIFFVPIFDTLLVSVTRRSKERAISQGARDHSSHRLVFMGLSERQAAAFLWSMSAFAGLAAILARYRWGRGTLGIAGLFLLGGSVFWLYHVRLDLPASWMSEVSGRVAPIPRQWQRIVVEIFLSLIDVAAISLAFTFACLAELGRLSGGVSDGAIFVGGMILVCKMLVLVVFRAANWSWSIHSRRDIYPLLVCALLAPFLLVAAPALLTNPAKIEPSVILLDAIFSFLLLWLCRASDQIFNRIFRREPIVEVPSAHSVLGRLELPQTRMMRPSEPRISENARAQDAG